MKDQMLICPSSKGLLIRDPVTMTPLSEDGEIKPLRGKLGRYWRRRLKDGTVIELKKEVKPEPVREPEEEPEKEEAKRPVTLGTKERQSKENRRR